MHGSPPVFRTWAAGVALDFREFVEDPFEPLVLQIMTHPFGDGVDQPDLFFQERTFVGLRRTLRIEHVDAASGHLVLQKVGPDTPRRLREPGGGVCRVAHDDADSTQGRVLPPGRDRGDDPLEHLVLRRVQTPEDLLHLVQAVELLGPLPQ